MIENPVYCMSSYLMYRMIVSDDYCFSNKYKPKLANIFFDRYPVYNSNDLYNHLREIMEQYTTDGASALALSGGIDSAILASMMPKGSTAYTFRCVVPGVSVFDESNDSLFYIFTHLMPNSTRISLTLCSYDIHQIKTECHRQLHKS